MTGNRYVTGDGHHAGCGHLRSAIVASFCEHEGCYNARKRSHAGVELPIPPVEAEPYEQVSILVPIAGAFATGVFAGVVLMMVLVR